MKIKSWNRYNEGIISYFKDRKKRGAEFQAKRTDIEQFIEDELLVYNDDGYFTRSYIDTTAGNKSIDIKLRIFLKDVKIFKDDDTPMSRGQLFTYVKTSKLKDRRKDFVYLANTIQHTISNFERNGYELITYRLDGEKFRRDQSSEAGDNLSTVTQFYLEFSKPL
jgi:hypothetical protein